MTISVRGKENADALYDFISARKDNGDLCGGFRSLIGPVRRKRTTDLFDLCLTLPAKPTTESPG